MSGEKIIGILADSLKDLRERGALKGKECVTLGYRPPRAGFGPRWLLAGEGEREFLRMNSNSYLGLALDPEVAKAAERGVKAFGTGPGAVRFISGTCRSHVELEERLAEFHRRESAMLFSAAYAAVMAVIPPLVTPDTVVVSDELNHNSIIHALRLSRPKAKEIYPHLDMAGLEKALERHAGDGVRAVVVTDGVFSMRGDHAPLHEMARICSRYEERYAEGVIFVVDDSHGVGALGGTGRGTEESTGGRADILISTLGKALGVNGGYAAATETVIAYLREVAPFYVYSNPISPAEASAALQSLTILDSNAGREKLSHLRKLTARFREGLAAMGLETLHGEHPIVPLMVRDTDRARRLTAHLYEQGILATALQYPVVPKGDEEIRFQMSSDHTEGDLEYVLETLRRFDG